MRIAVRALATARLTRFITTDVLLEWLILGRLRAWADRHEWRLQSEDPPESWQGRLVSGLDCPFCVGFWVGLIVLALPDNRFTRWVLGGLALNYLVGHVSSRVDGGSDDEESSP